MILIGIETMNHECRVTNLQKQVYIIFKASKTLIEIGKLADQQVILHSIFAFLSTRPRAIWVIQKVLQLRSKAQENVFNWLLMPQPQKWSWTIAGLIHLMHLLINEVSESLEEVVLHVLTTLLNRCHLQLIFGVIQILKDNQGVWNRLLTQVKVCWTAILATYMFHLNMLQVVSTTISDKFLE